MSLDNRKLVPASGVYEIGRTGQHGGPHGSFNHEWSLRYGITS